MPGLAFFTDLLGNKVNTHAGTFKYILRFLNHFVIRVKKVNYGNELLKVVKRKDKKVSKHYFVTIKHENNNKKERKIICLSWGSNPPT